MNKLSQWRLFASFVILNLTMISVASATNQLPQTLSTAQPGVGHNQAECMGDSMGHDCVGTNQLEASYPYDLIPQNDGPVIPEVIAINIGDEYAQDHLSERDKLIYNSKEPTYWRASDQDTLKQVLFVHRHGDRTPINFAPKDKLADEPFWKFHGLGQLTNRGKARLHLLGKIIRQRYDTFMNGSVSKNSRKTRASGSLRCIESSQAFLSSFLSLDNANSPDAASLKWDKPEDVLAQLWQPASILTLSARYDGLMNEGADCQSLFSEYSKLDQSEDSQHLLKEFKHEVDVLKAEMDFDIDHFYKWFWAGSFVEIERSYFERKMSPALLSIYDRLQKASDRSLLIYQSSSKVRRLKAGLLINDIIENMNGIRDSSNSPYAKKFVEYSGHDITLIFLLGLLENIEKYPYRPDYGSNIAFELHEDQSEWFVKIFYMPHVPSKPFELHMEACEKGHAKGRCTLEKFGNLMQKYRITSWTDWMRECGNPMTSFNPYEENL